MKDLSNLKLAISTLEYTISKDEKFYAVLNNELDGMNNIKVTNHIGYEICKSSIEYRFVVECDLNITDYNYIMSMFVDFDYPTQVECMTID